MRIIAGDMKGRRLTTPKDNRVRPTSDKVKEAVFSMVAPYIEDAIVVDLFTGTGNLGLEAISRGAKLCYFADKSGESLALVRQNIEYCKAQESSRVVQGEFERALDKIDESSDKLGEKPYIFFLDPPYGSGYIGKCLTQILELDLLADGGIIVAEHELSERIECTGFYKQREKRYGKIGVTVFERSEQDLEEQTK